MSAQFASTARPTSRRVASGQPVEDNVRALRPQRGQKYTGDQHMGRVSALPVKQLATGSSAGSVAIPRLRPARWGDHSISR
jgi:hypothetical protein